MTAEQSVVTGDRPGAGRSVVILDYGLGNIRSAQRAVARTGAEVTVSVDHDAAVAADGLVVPGVGAFAACMDGLLQVGGDAIIAERVAAGKPVLGICRGAQLVNVACGGSLRDLDPVEARRHSDPSAYAAHQHAVSFSDGGLLARLHAAAGGLVCSAHRQAVARVGDGLVVEATCVEDGVVEAVRAREEPLLLGVQWHPEFDHRADGRIDGALLLRHFVDAARRDEGAR